MFHVYLLLVFFLFSLINTLVLVVVLVDLQRFLAFHLIMQEISITKTTDYDMAPFLTYIKLCHFNNGGCYFLIKTTRCNECTSDV